MARKIHKSLEYEKKELAHAKYMLGVLSDVLYDIDKELGSSFIENQVWSYGCGITFKDTDQEQYAFIKSILPRLSQLDKESSKYGICLKGKFSDDVIAGKPVDLVVSFKWDVPDTCEIVTKVIKEKVGTDYYVDENGDIFHNKTEVEVNCTQPVLESVFQNKESASG